MTLRFFCYSFMRVCGAGEVVEDIAAMIEASRAFERKSAMMLFAFVPTPLLAEVLSGVDRSFVKVSAQDIAVPHACEIAGELSLERLLQLDADMALAGSLDRRIALGETDERIARKMDALLRSGLKSVLGVGELSGGGCGDGVTSDLDGAAADLDGAASDLDGAAADRAIEQQIAAGFASVPESAYFRTGVVYQHAWSMGERACKTPRGYVEARLAAIRGALRKAVPDAPIDSPVFSGGCTGEDEAVSYLGEGLFDGIFVDDRQWSTRSFCSVLERVCGCERP